MTTPGGPARYDGFADWYEAFNTPHATANRAELEHTLGAGGGLCLDLGCGTGLYFDAIRATGRIPIGLDRSADQLRYARLRGLCVQADAATLPFPDRVFPTVVMVWLHRCRRLRCGRGRSRPRATPRRIDGLPGSTPLLHRAPYRVPR